MLHGSKRAARGDDGAAVRPAHRIIRRALALRRGVGERQDHRTRIDLGHALDRAFGEGARRGRHADQNGRPGVGNRLLEGDPRPILARPGGDLVDVACIGRLEILEAGPVTGDQALRVHRPDPPSRLGEGQPAFDEGRNEEVGDALGRCPGAGEEQALIADRLAGQLQPAVDAGQDDGGRALDVVVERRQLVAEAMQLRDRIGLEKVFPLQQRVRVHPPHGVDEAIDERLVLVAAHALVGAGPDTADRASRSSLSVPTSSMIGSVWYGETPAQIV